MAADWWTFWDPAFGYRRDDWFKRYQQERMDRPLKPGKTRRLPVSNTRRVLNWIVDAAAPVCCLETNIHAGPSDLAASLAESRRITKPFDFLLKTVRPAVILAHGDDAIEHIATRARVPLAWGQEVRAGIGDNDVWIIAEAHFGRPRGGRGWSQERAEAVGRRLRQLATSQVAA
jgi:hypothetical protein